MFGSLKKIFFPQQNGSASKVLARSRLHFVLVQDRTGLTPEEMARFKEEMVGVIEKYFMIDKTGFDISYKRDLDTTTLLINSPVIVRKKGEGDQPANSSNAHGSGKKFKKRHEVRAAETKAPEAKVAEELESTDESQASI